MHFIYSSHFFPINLCTIITICVNYRYIINLTIYCQQLYLKSKVSLKDINKRKIIYTYMCVYIYIYIFTHIITIFGVLHSLICIHIFIWHHFPSARMSAFKISYHVSMPIINSLAFVCLENFQSPLFLKNCSCKQNFRLKESSVTSLKIMLHCLLTCIVSNRKSDVILIFLLLFITSLSFLAAFMISSLSLGLNNLIMKCHCVFFLVLVIHTTS